MLNWFYKSKLTDKQKIRIKEENNGWFTEKEIYKSFDFEIPKGQLEIPEKVIYFNLEILTGINFTKMPGDIQSLYWYFCEIWETKKKDVKLFLETEFGFIFPFIFNKIKIPYAGLLFALDNSLNYEEERNYINTVFSSSDKIKSIIDFDKYDINKEKFYESILFYLEINEICAPYKLYDEEYF